jgi:hypothetical protein
MGKTHIPFPSFVASPTAHPTRHPTDAHFFFSKKTSQLLSGSSSSTAEPSKGNLFLHTWSAGYPPSLALQVVSISPLMISKTPRQTLHPLCTLCVVLVFSFCVKSIEKSLRLINMQAVAGKSGNSFALKKRKQSRYTYISKNTMSWRQNRNTYLSSKLHIATEIAYKIKKKNRKKNKRVFFLQ